METREFGERRPQEIDQQNIGQHERTPASAPMDPREDSGSRWRLWDRLKTAISSEHPAVSAHSTPAAPSSATPDLDHERARQLLIAERSSRLPAADANALSAHLLTCDSCYRFAQDLAARSRQP